MATERKCPECGVMNPISRMTCMACHMAMVRKPPSALPKTHNPFSGDNGGVNKDAPEAPTVGGKDVPAPARRKRSPRNKPPTTTPVPDASNPTPAPAPKPTRTRAPRKRTRKAPTESVLLKLEGDRLIHVKMVNKLVKIKDAPDQVRRLVGLWARTRKLFK